MNDEVFEAMRNPERLEGAEAIEALESFQLAYTAAAGHPHGQAAELLTSMRDEINKPS